MQCLLQLADRPKTETCPPLPFQSSEELARSHREDMKQGSWDREQLRGNCKTKEVHEGDAQMAQEESARQELHDPNT